MRLARLITFAAISAILMLCFLALVGWFRTDPGFEPVYVLLALVLGALLKIFRWLHKPHGRTEGEPPPYGDQIYHTSEGNLAPPLQRPPRAEHFTGRQAELAQILEDIQPGRVVTLCGPGGIGKTALAAEAVWTLAPGDDPPDRFPDGIIFHSFYNQPQVSLIIEAIVRAYDEEPRPSPLTAVQRALAGREALLVLDGAENADDLQSILDVRDQCGVLITSRTRHDAVTDWHQINPLGDSAAVDLLQAWAPRQTAAHCATTRICALVGNLPLAIRLAGRYMAHTEQPATQYLNWLDTSPLAALDHGKRQRDSIPILLENSLGQVSEEARSAVGVIGMLALQSFPLEPVAAAFQVPPAIAGHHLGQLVNFGLLDRISGRFVLTHPLLHAYARQNVCDSIPAGALDRLAAYYRELAAEMTAAGPDGYAVLDNERAHLMAILARCVDGQDWQTANNLSFAMDEYLEMQGHWTERVAVIKDGLAAAQALRDRRLESAFLGNLGNACSALGQTDRAIDYYEEALAITREIGDRHGEGNQVGNLGNAYRELGQVARAIDYYQETLAITRQIGDRRCEGAALGNLGNAYSALGQIVRAIEYYDQALEISRQITDRRDEGAVLGNLGRAYRELGQVERAIEYLEQGLKIFREIGDRRGEGAQLGSLGTACSDLGQGERAVEYHEQALKISRAIGDRHGEAGDLGALGLAYSALGQVERAIEYLEQGLEISRAIGDRRGEGDGLVSLGLACGAAGQVERAIEYFEQALEISRAIGDRRGELTAAWYLGLEYEHSDPARAVELMSISVGYAHETSHHEAEKIAWRVEQIRARL